MPKTFSRPGPRFLYPDVVSSRSLARCSLVANALWPRLIVQADDQGRMPGDAGSVLVACFPKLLDRVTLAEVSAALDELREAGMVLIYSGPDGESFLQIVGWWRWQQGMRRAYASRFPQPRGWIDVTYGYEDQPSSFGNALETGHFVLDSDGRVRAARGQSAGKVRARRPRTAANARAQGPDPIRSDPSNPDPSVPDPSGSASARRRAAPDTGGAHAPGVPTNGARLVGNAYASFEVLTGKPPSEKVASWLDDECGRYGREHVVRVMYATPDPTRRDWMNRVKDALRGKAAAAEPAEDDVDFDPPQARAAP